MKKKGAIQEAPDSLQQFAEWQLMSHFKAIDGHRARIGWTGPLHCSPIPSCIIQVGRN
jgi:hypothetical protein